jgi:hypothetical protein
LDIKAGHQVHNDFDSGKAGNDVQSHITAKEIGHRSGKLPMRNPTVHYNQNKEGLEQAHAGNPGTCWRR